MPQDCFRCTKGPHDACSMCQYLSSRCYLISDPQNLYGAYAQGYPSYFQNILAYERDLFWISRPESYKVSISALNSAVNVYHDSPIGAKLVRSKHLYSYRPVSVRVRVKSKYLHSRQPASARIKSKHFLSFCYATGRAHLHARLLTSATTVNTDSG